MGSYVPQIDEYMSFLNDPSHCGSVLAMAKSVSIASYAGYVGSTAGNGHEGLRMVKVSEGLLVPTCIHPCRLQQMFLSFCRGFSSFSPNISCQLLTHKKACTLTHLLSRRYHQATHFPLPLALSDVWSPLWFTSWLGGISLYTYTRQGGKIQSGENHCVFFFFLDHVCVSLYLRYVSSA